MKSIFLIFFFFSSGAWALVTTSAGLGAGKQRLDLRLTREGGKIKPSRDKDSWQNADNRIATIGYTRSTTLLPFGSDQTIGIEYRRLSFPKEEAEGVVFHNADEGNQLSLNLGFNLHHEVDSSLGVILQVSPLTDFNEDKFAVTRVDLFRLGFGGGFNFGESFFFQGSFLVGSGIPGHQNSYTLLTQSIGYRLRDDLTVKVGPYMETDLEERVDEKYTAVYTSSPSEKTRLFKTGFQFGLDWRLGRSDSLQFDYLQKIYGQSLPATNALSLNWAHKF